MNMIKDIAKFDYQKMIQTKQTQASGWIQKIQTGEKISKHNVSIL